MFGMRTPVGKAVGDRSPLNVASPEAREANVRRSIGEWEAGKLNTTMTLTEETTRAGPSGSKPVVSQGEKQPTASKASSPNMEKCSDRVAEARRVLHKAKTYLGGAKNLKTEIRTEVTIALDKLYQLVKSSDGAKVDGKPKVLGQQAGPKKVEQRKSIAENVPHPFDQELVKRLEVHERLMVENSARMDELKETLQLTLEKFAERTYAHVVAGHSNHPEKPTQERETLHSVCVTSKNEAETGEQVLSKIREAVDAKEGWIRVERVRKARDRKVIIGLRTKEDRERIKERLTVGGTDLSVEEVENRDPLLVLKGVFTVNTDEDIIKALRNQNRAVFRDLDEETGRVKIRYRKRTRNPHMNHVVISVSPVIWRRALDIGILHIDLQRIGVEDQSPLVQCSRCLGYGHGKRSCRDSQDICSHCGGPHLRTECAEWLAEATPSCINCRRAGIDRADHNAFSAECPIRKKWDNLARSSVAYC